MAQSENAWRKLADLPPLARAQRFVRPHAFQAFHLDTPALKRGLNAVPKEAPQIDFDDGQIVSLPMPDGALQRFQVLESPVMAPELAAKYPEIKTYAGRGIDDPGATVRFGLTPAGFHGQILSPKGAVYIDPAAPGDATSHISFFKRDYQRIADGFTCLVDTDQQRAARPLARDGELMRSGASLRTYRLACAATGEYTQFHGGTVAAGLAAIVTAINRVNGIYEQEFAIRLVLVANNNLIVYTNGSSDPYSNSNGSLMLGQNQDNLDSVIGNANYDIGHVFSTGGGGIAGLGVVCDNGAKGEGVTGLSAPTGDAFYIDYVSHEIGHQFGANHTFNGIGGSCGSNRNGETAYEPGSGSTIMGYTGICSSDNLQVESDPYFHAISFDEVISFSTTGSGNSCPTVSATGNAAPTVNAGGAYAIPQGTPFILTANGSDPNSDALSYCWEQFDLGPAQSVLQPDNGSSPIFRSFNPTPNPFRIFPRLEDILNNSASLGEQMPGTSRTLHFRVTARDNRTGGGGVATADTQVIVHGTAGPFQITAPVHPNVWSASQVVRWDVAGTASSPINAGTVNILLSTNNGESFSIVLQSGTPNDGVQTVVLPNIASGEARIKVEAVGNIFFDISDRFTLTTYTPSPIVVLEAAIVTAESCPPGNSSIDPNETVTVDFTLKNVGGANASDVTASLEATGGITSPSTAQNYGLIAPGETVTRSFTFVANGSCGGTITATLQLDDSGTALSPVTHEFQLSGLAPVTATFQSWTIKIPNTVQTGNGHGIAFPYPSTIAVADINGLVESIQVSFVGLKHTFPDDIDALLVGPNDQHVMLMSDAGGGDDLTGVDLIFRGDATNSLPDTSQITSGEYLPSNFSPADVFVPPAPEAPHGNSLSVFNGIEPNGEWSLYVTDDGFLNIGSMVRWQLTITTFTPECCTGQNPAGPSLRVALENENIVLTWDSVAGQGYEVQYKTDLNDPNWNTLTTVTADGPTTTVNDPITDSQKFYRLAIP